MHREPTNDEHMGMVWWNRIDAAERARWLKAAGSAVPAEAWAAFKREQTSVVSQDATDSSARRIGASGGGREPSSEVPA